MSARSPFPFPQLLPSELRAAILPAVEGAEVILLHSAPRSIGPVVGGIDAVVSVLLSALGPARTLVVPTFTPDLVDPSCWQARPSAARMEAIRREMPIFDAATTTPQQMGRLADQLWRRPEALRSAHPVESIAAIGPRAEELTRRHPIDDPMGPRSPWARMVELDARVMLLGVGLTRCTMVHHAERLERVPYQSVAAYAMPMELEGPGGARTWIEVDEAGGSCSDGFGALEPLLFAEGGLRELSIGNARTLTVSSRELVRIARALLSRDHAALLCESLGCAHCCAARPLCAAPRG